MLKLATLTSMSFQDGSLLHFILYHEVGDNFCGMQVKFIRQSTIFADSAG